MFPCQGNHKMLSVWWYQTELTVSGFPLLRLGWWGWGRRRRGAQANLGVLVLQHVNPFTNLLERPGRFSLARLLHCLPCCDVTIALTWWADAHQLLMGTIAAMATVTTGAHVVDRLEGEKSVFILVCRGIKWGCVCARVSVYILGVAACGFVH